MTTSRKKILYGVVIGVGVYLLLFAMGEAQNPAANGTLVLFEIFIGFAVGSLGVLGYRWQKSQHENRSRQSELEKDEFVYNAKNLINKKEK